MNRIRFLDTNSTIQVIGSVYKNPSLLNTSNLTSDDFPKDFHKIVYGTFYKLFFENGLTNFTDDVILDFIEARPNSYGIFKENGGMDFIHKAAEIASETSYKYYYDRLKKMTLLRGYSNVGFDVREFYDEDNILDTKKRQEQEEWLDSNSLVSIGEQINSKIDYVFNKYADDSADMSCAAGDNILELIESLRENPAYGLPFYDNLYTAATMGRRLGKYYLRSASTGLGKAIPNYTMIPTPVGYRAVGDIKVGDYLFGQNGKSTKVLAVYPQTEEKEIWQITFSDGRIAECCGEHLWEYGYPRRRGLDYRVESIQSFYDRVLKSRQGLCTSKKKYRFHVRLNEPVEYENKIYSLDPYVMGAFLGNGSFRYSETNKVFNFSPNNTEVLDNIISILGKEYSYVKTSSDYCFKHTSDITRPIWVEEILKDSPELWNVKSKDKFIPKQYLLGSIEQRYSLLQGLMDTSGSIDTKGKTIFATISSQLRDDVIELCQSLGFIATYSVDARRSKYMIGECYNVRIQCKKKLKPKLFRLSKNISIAQEYALSTGKEEVNGHIAITKILKTTKKTAMTCFTVDADDHLFLTNNFIVTHNTRTLSQDAAFSSVSRYYDSKRGDWVDNPAPQPTLFIATEQAVDEIQTLLLSFVAEVDETKILEGSYTAEEYQRVIEAAKIIQDAPLRLEFMPDYSMQEIERVIKYNILEYNINYIYFDYLQSTMKILTEIASQANIKIREDQILFLLSTKLKDIAVQYNVFIETSTQLSGDLDTLTPDQRLLRGSKSIGDKLDFGCHLLSLTDVDRDNLVGLTQKFIDGKMPNIKLAIYKNRRGKHNSIYLWGYKRLDVCRIDFAFATTWQYEFVDLQPIEVNVNA